MQSMTVTMTDIMWGSIMEIVVQKRARCYTLLTKPIPRVIDVILILLLLIHHIFPLWTRISAVPLITAAAPVNGTPARNAQAEPVARVTASPIVPLMSIVLTLHASRDDAMKIIVKNIVPRRMSWFVMFTVSQPVSRALVTIIVIHWPVLNEMARPL